MDDSLVRTQIALHGATADLLEEVAGAVTDLGADAGAIKRRADNQRAQAGSWAAMLLAQEEATEELHGACVDTRTAEGLIRAGFPVYSVPIYARGPRKD